MSPSSNFQAAPEPALRSRSVAAGKGGKGAHMEPLRKEGLHMGALPGRAPTASERDRLKFLRESLLHTPSTLRYLGEWWLARTIRERRDLLAFSGLDDSEEMAARRWEQMLPEHRDELVLECRRLHRMVEFFR